MEVGFGGADGYTGWGAVDAFGEFLGERVISVRSPRCLLGGCKMGINTYFGDALL